MRLAEILRTLGVTPILGRDFHAGEDAPAAPPTAGLALFPFRNTPRIG
jgi:hypothetical protein